MFLYTPVPDFPSISELMAKTKGDKVKVLEAKTTAVLKKGCIECKKLLNTTSIASPSNLVGNPTQNTKTNQKAGSEQESRTTPPVSSQKLIEKPTSVATERKSERSGDEDGYGSELLVPRHVVATISTSNASQNKSTQPLTEKSPKSRLALSRRKNAKSTDSPDGHVSAFTRVAPKRQSTEDSEQLSKKQKVLTVKPGPLDSSETGLKTNRTPVEGSAFKPPVPPSTINTNFSEDVRLTRRRTRSMDKPEDAPKEGKVIVLEACGNRSQDRLGSVKAESVVAGDSDVTMKTRGIKGLKRVTHTNTSSSNLSKIPHHTTKGKTPSKLPTSAIPHPVEVCSDTSKEQGLTKSSQLSKFSIAKEKLAGHTKVC